MFSQASDQRRQWFAAALLIPLYFSLISAGFAFSQEYVVQDDVRHHVSWLQQLVNPDLFPNDIIADYFISLSPTLFRWFYHLAALLGVDPLVLAKLLPILLGVIASGYYFGVCLELFPVPVGAWISTLFFNQIIWLQQDVISATPRALVNPLLAAFLYYLLRHKTIPCLLVVLLSFCYPTLALIEIGILTLRLIDWDRWKPRLTTNRQHYVLWAAGFVITLGFFLFYVLREPEFGSFVSRQQMLEMPEFQAGGRVAYFRKNPWEFWLWNNSGLLPPWYPPVLLLGLCLPWVKNTRLPWVNRVTPKVQVLRDILLTSGGLFVLAHLALLYLYFPSRYSSIGLRFVLCFASGIVVTIWLHALWQWLQMRWQRRKFPALRQWVWLFPVMVFAIASLIIPALPPIFLPAQAWIVGEEPQLYEFIAQQPQDSMIASLSTEAENLPVFTQRSVLVCYEFALPVHLKYYEPIRQRTLELLEAQYSPSLQATRKLVKEYGINLFLVDQNAFTPDYVRGNRWLAQYPETAQTTASLEQGNRPAWLRLRDRCSVFSNDRLFVMDASCLVQ